MAVFVVTHFDCSISYTTTDLFTLLRVSGMISGEFCKTFQEDIIIISYKILQRMEKEGRFSNLFSVTSITLKPIPKDIIRKKNYGSISLMSMNVKILNKI